LFLFEFLDDLEHAVPLFDGVVDGKPQYGCVLHHHRAAHQSLKPNARFFQKMKATTFLLFSAQDADADCGMFKIAGHLHHIHADESSSIHWEFPAYDLTELTLEEFVDAL
jgi:hypothetical protein